MSSSFHRPSAIHLEMLEINSPMFGICAFLFTVFSFSFLESSAILTDSIYGNIARLTKQISSMFLVFFQGVSDSLVFRFLF